MIASQYVGPGLMRQLMVQVYVAKWNETLVAVKILMGEEAALLDSETAEALPSRSSKIHASLYQVTMRDCFLSLLSCRAPAWFCNLQPPVRWHHCCRLIHAAL